MWLAEDERERFSSPIKHSYLLNGIIPRTNINEMFLGIMQSLSTIWIYMMQAILASELVKWTLCI